MIVPLGKYTVLNQAAEMNSSATAAHPYTVKLEDAEGVPSGLRIEAEARFASKLESVLGSPGKVADAYRAWLAASEAQPEDLKPADVMLAQRWFRAAGDANEAGFRNLGAMPGAHFEVRLAGHR